MFSYWSSPSVHHRETFPERNFFNHKNCNINFSLNTSSDQVPSVEFLLKSLTSNKSILEQESKYLNSIRVFPFFISFSCWNKINKKSLIKEVTRKIENCKAVKEYTRKMENCKAYNVPEKRFSQKLPETGVSNYYARKI